MVSQKRIRNYQPRKSKPKKVKGAWDEEWTSDESEVEDQASNQGGKRTFATLFTESLDRLAAVPQEKRKTVPATTAVRCLSFLPNIPSVVGEKRAELAGRTSKFMRAVDAKESFNGKGNPVIAFREDTCPRQFLPELAAFFAQQRRRLGAATSSSQAAELLNDVAGHLSLNVNELIRHMEIERFPTASRELLSEVLHDMKRTVESESAVLGREIIDHTVNYLYKTGRIASLAGEIARGLRQPRQEAHSLNSSEVRFVFDPARYPNQKKHADPKYQICYKCVNRLFKEGKLKEGQNPPDSVWFPSYKDLMKHKKERKC